MSPAIFLLVAVALSALGSMVVWLVLRERQSKSDAMTDFRRTMSALDPNEKAGGRNGRRNPPGG